MSYFLIVPLHIYKILIITDILCDRHLYSYYIGEGIEVERSQAALFFLLNPP